MPVCAVPDAAETDAALAFDDALHAELRAAWLRLAELAVFGDLRGAAIGALPRLRKRVLDLGERLRALLADRGWIPRPRERLKNALASALAARDALAECGSQAAAVEGGADRAALLAAIEDLERVLAPVLTERANVWAALLARREDDDDNG